jgi:hypothetical protein
MIGSENLGRHAVGATQIALIRERHPEIAQRARQEIVDTGLRAGGKSCGIFIQTKNSKR